MIDYNHELVLLADKIDWDYFHNQFEKLFQINLGKFLKGLDSLLDFLY